MRPIFDGYMLEVKDLVFCCAATIALDDEKFWIEARLKE